MRKFSLTGQFLKKREWDVLLVGRYFCDLIFTCLQELPRLGHEVYSREFHLVPGGVYSPALTLTRLGIHIIWPSFFGSDPFSQFVKNRAIEEGVDGSFFSDLTEPSLKITVAFSFSGERAFLSYMDPDPPLPYLELITENKPKWLYITHLMIGRELNDLVQAAKDSGTKIYMDCQANDYSIDDEELINAIKSVDYFSPNLEEAKRLTNSKNLESALEILGKYAQSLIIKLGKQGCIYKSGKKMIRSKAIPVNAVDTTGAGDNFNCGFLFGQITGHSLEQSLQLGNICGGLSVQSYGGASFDINSNMIKELLDTYY